MVSNHYAIIRDVRLAGRTSIGLGGRVIAELKLEDERGCEALPGLEKTLGGKLLFLGAGTNIIAADHDLPLLLASLPRQVEPEITGEDGEKVFLRAAGGMPLPLLLARAASLGLSGLEGLAGVPGSVGGAVAMNAGSFGVAIGDLAWSVRLFSPRLGIVERPAGDFSFAYRHCSLAGHDGHFMVLAVTLALTRKNGDQAREAMRAVMIKKKAAQPVGAQSAGCVFKNPAPDVPAGRLLDEAGLKGKEMGGMRFSPLHANFLVNTGGGRAAEAFALIDMAREKVSRSHGFYLETEVKLWR